MKASTIWLVSSLTVAMATGIIGDYIFNPIKMNFSFTIMSGYAVALALLIAGVNTFNDKR